MDSPSNPRVSIVIAHNGRDADLCNLLGCIRMQSCRTYEIIVVCDGCVVEPSLIELIGENASRTRLIFNQKRKGPYHARLRGAAIAKGEYLWFPDHDDIVESTFLEKMLNCAEGSNADIVSCGLLIIPFEGLPFIFERFMADQIRDGQDILGFYIEGGIGHSLADKLIKRRLWEEVINDLPKYSSQPIILCDDVIPALHLFDRANILATTRETSYGYIKRRSSTMNTSRREVLVEALASLEVASKILAPMIFNRVSKKEYQLFCSREICWFLDDLISRLDADLSEEEWAIVKEINLALANPSEYSNRDITPKRVLDSIDKIDFDKRCLDTFCELGDFRLDRIMIVVAHPDDEVIGAGITLSTFPVVHVVYVTNGAPPSVEKANQAGFRTVQEYSDARRKESTTALSLAGVASQNIARLGFLDSVTTYTMKPLVHEILRAIEQIKPSLIITHPYEGGHPDHDTTCLCVHLARDYAHRYEYTDEKIPIVEMTSYFVASGQMVASQFIDEGGDSVTIPLEKSQQNLKRMMLECHESQAYLLNIFPVETERFRVARAYDFTKPPAGGYFSYDMYPDSVDSKEWLQAAKDIMSIFSRESA